MIRIRPIHDVALSSEKRRVADVQAIFRDHFGAVADYADKIPQLVQNPFKYGYRTILLVSETASGRVTGFSLFLHFPEIASSLLDFMAVARGIRGGGVGGALYEATRDYLRMLKSRGLYMEVLPDSPEKVADPAVLADNRRRLRFYERYGARPIVDTDYETPIDDDPAAPFLLFDGLGREEPLGRGEARAAVRLILRRKYGHLVKQDYIERVVESFVDDPVHIRPPRYLKASPGAPPSALHGGPDRAFAMVYSDEHRIHHVQDRGYVERPARVDVLVESLNHTGLFDIVPPRHSGDQALKRVHEGHFVDYLKAVCSKLKSDRPIYPYVFPIRRPERRPRDLALRAGYYCIDTFTPLDPNAYKAARSAVDVAATAAQELLAGRRVVYAVCRPPGHHAERRTFGGFCYFNNGAVAADMLSREGRVAILDIDYHHGNGQQDIFYRRGDVLTVSIHGHPNYAYPYFSGFSDEKGEGDGVGRNHNFPLPEGAGENEYAEAFKDALKIIRRFAPRTLVLCLGFDTMRGDPTGSFGLAPAFIKGIGVQLAGLHLPILVVQEGGYTLGNLRKGATALFTGIANGIATPGGA